MNSENEPVTDEWFLQVSGASELFPLPPHINSAFCLTGRGIFVNHMLCMLWRDRAHCRKVLEAFDVRLLEPPPLTLDRGAQGRNRLKPYNPDHQEYPAILNNKEFRDAWVEWVKYRREEARKPISQSMANSWLKLLAKFGSTIAIDSMSTCMSNGWLGLFPENETRRQRNGKPDCTREFVYTEDDAKSGRGNDVVGFR